MAVRITYSEVLEIMDNCTVGTSIINNLIIEASAIVDSVFIEDETMTEAMLKSVEKWLTAHMLASTLSRTTSEEKLGDASLTYTGKWGQGLSSTPYGQMVLILDVTGKMAKMGLKGASIRAVKSFDE
jgi:hypothetical protein